MSKALVIKGVDFSDQKVTTVNFLEEIPCTGISLSESTKSMSSVNSTFTLIPITTPLNTTDQVLWSTNNANIATVANGVVTQTGVGTVVITASCGGYTATCTITATNVLTFDYELQAQAAKVDITGRDYNALVKAAGVSANYGAIFSKTGSNKKIYNSSNGAVEGSVYPLSLGGNATTLTITVPSSIRATVWFVDENTACTYSASSSSFAAYAKYISGDSTPYDSSVSLGNRTVSVPEGANAVNITLQKPGSGNSVSAEDMAATTITVG